MTQSPETLPDQPALDEGDENADEFVGEPVEAEHDLDLDSFDVEED